MLVVCFDAKGVVHQEFVPPGQIVNAWCDVDVLEKMRIRVHRVRKETGVSWVFHRDNASSHTVLRFRQFLANTTWQPYPSPLTDWTYLRQTYFCFWGIKTSLKADHCFNGIKEIQTTLKTTTLDEIFVEAFQRILCLGKLLEKKVYMDEGSTSKVSNYILNTFCFTTTIELLLWSQLV